MTHNLASQFETRLVGGLLRMRTTGLLTAEVMRALKRELNCYADEVVSGALIDAGASVYAMTDDELDDVVLSGQVDRLEVTAG